MAVRTVWELSEETLMKCHMQHMTQPNKLLFIYSLLCFTRTILWLPKAPHWFYLFVLFSSLIFELVGSTQVRKTWMGVATGEWLPLTAELAITWICPEQERKQLLRLLISTEMAGWTEEPGQLSLTFQCTMPTLTCSVWSGLYEGTHASQFCVFAWLF